jgi:hypothetical protein
MTTDDAMSCPQCHQPAVPGAAFCEECGARLEAPPAPIEEAVEAVISERGVKFELVRWTGKLSKAVAAGNIIIGVLKSAPGAVGAGVLANVQRSVFMKWPEIRKVTFFPRQRVVTLSNSWRPVVRLHCPDDEIYEQLRVLLETKVPEGGGTLSRS